MNTALLVIVLVSPIVGYWGALLAWSIHPSGVLGYPRSRHER
jgi:hypothetical protein